jgi:carboxymethylenebutenolidase
VACARSKIASVACERAQNENLTGGGGEQLVYTNGATSHAGTRAKVFGNHPVLDYFIGHICNWIFSKLEGWRPEIEVAQLAAPVHLRLAAVPNLSIVELTTAFDMNDQRESGAEPTDRRQFLERLWEEHMRHEFATHNTEDTLATMVDDAYVNHIPVLTGGVGKQALREFYSKRFIPQMPRDTEVTPVSRTIGTDQLVDEMIFKFTHTMRMDWMLPGVEPTGRRVEVPLVAIVRFRDNKLAHEHIYWDQASVLVQLGLLDEGKLPVAGVETARKVLDNSLPSNALMECAGH